MFCFPYAGGGASIFQTWPAQLPRQVEVCAVQLPGRENRLKEAPFTKLEPLVEYLLDVLHPYLDKPFALFGHSMGAIIAFKFAHQVRRKYKLTPVHLFASAREAPSVPLNRNPPFFRLSKSTFIERLRDLKGTPEELLDNPELLDVLLPVLRADFEIDETYVHTPSELLDCPISTFRGTQDTLATYDEVAAWRTESNGTFTLRSLPGGHFFIQTAKELFLQILSYDLSTHFKNIQ